MKYTVRKSKRNRSTFRLVGMACMLVGIMQISLLIIGYGRERFIANAICTFLLIYGTYLFITTFKKQYYDITYYFNDDNITIEHKRGKNVFSYDEVEDVFVIEADADTQSYLLHLKIGKDDFVIPFTFKKELCEKIYEHINSKISQDEK